LYFYLAPNQYNSNYNAYKPVNASPTKVVPTTFAQQIEKDLKIAIANGCPQITVYVHGLANYFSDTCEELGTYGTNLQKQGYNGLVIAFDWPSYGEVDSYVHYGSLPYSFPRRRLPARYATISTAASKASLPRSVYSPASVANIR
jgi:hypothetical protein